MFDFEFAKVGFAEDGGEFPDEAGIESVLAVAHGISRSLFA